MPVETKEVPSERDRGMAVVTGELGLRSAVKRTVAWRVDSASGNPSHTGRADAAQWRRCGEREAHAPIGHHAFEREQES